MTLPGANVTNFAASLTEVITTFTFIFVNLASLDELRDNVWGMENGNHFPLAVMLVVMVNVGMTVSGWFLYLTSYLDRYFRRKHEPGQKPRCCYTSE